jgi:thiol:disulfide interchange protein
MRRRRFIGLAGLLLLAEAVAAGLPLDFDPSRDAVADVASAVRQAKLEGKRVLVDVGGQWCAWCRIMDRFFASNDQARAIRDTHYVWVKVNWSKENRNEALLSRWPKIAGYPHLFVLDDDGRLLHSQDTSLLEQGRGYDAGRFVAFLERWRPPPHSR